MQSVAINKLDESEKFFIYILTGSVVIAKILPFYPIKIFFGFSLGLFFTYLCFSRVSLALWFFVFFMPIFAIFPLDFFGVKGLNAQTIVMLILLIGSWLTTGSSDFKTSASDPIKTPIITFVSIIFFSVINSTLFSPYSFAFLFATAKNWLVYIPLYFIVVTHCEERHYKKLSLLIFLVITIIATLSLKDYFTIPDYLDKHRNSGVLIGKQPNLFGGFMAIYIPFFITIAPADLTKTWRLLLGFGLLTCLIALYTTQSRGAWIGCCAAIVFLGIFNNRWLLLLFLLLAGYFTFCKSTLHVKNRYQETFKVTGQYQNQQFDNSTELRLAQWKGLPKMMASNPIIGHGFESFYDLVYESGVLPVKKSPHSLYLRLAVEEGILGILSFIWLLWAIFKNSWFVYRQSTEPFIKHLALGLAAAVIVLTIIEMSGCRFADSGIMAYFWIITGIVVKSQMDISQNINTNFYKERMFA